MSRLALLLLVGVVGSVLGRDDDHPRFRQKKAFTATDEGSEYWKKVAENEIEHTLEVLSQINTNMAKNVVIFVGDGMSIPTLTASRIYKAQYQGRQQGIHVNGEETLLTFEKFPHVGLSRTYNCDSQTSDSASTATALFSGIKTNINTLGFDNLIEYDDPTSELRANKVETILTWAQNAGMDTGIVTTARVSHATPAALYAHTANRDWECEKEMGTAASVTKDITWQLLNTDPGRQVKVVLGGGRSSFLPDEQTDDHWDYDDDEWECRRLDQTDLIAKFLRKSVEIPEFEGKTGKFVENREQLMSVDVANTDYLLGLFSWDHMKYDYERENDDPLTGEPSLSEMVKVAINMLSKSQDGFFLMVEAAKIDKGHHAGQANIALHDAMALDLAVETALGMLNLDETLVIVTADHGHTMEMAGYQSRGSDVRSYVDTELAQDGLPFSILSYANGPGFKEHLEAHDGKVYRVDLSEWDDYTTFETHQPTSAPMKKESHSGTDVAIFAKGPFAHFIHGVHEQNYIPYVMAYSACIGPYKGNCHSRSSNRSQNVKS